MAKKVPFAAQSHNGTCDESGLLAEPSDDVSNIFLAGLSEWEVDQPALTNVERRRSRICNALVEYHTISSFVQARTQYFKPERKKLRAMHFSQALDAFLYSLGVDCAKHKLALDFLIRRVLTILTNELTRAWARAS